MALWAISDLHLSLGCDKTMDVFGGGWENHTQRLAAHWRRRVDKNDYVVLNGDTSWATYTKYAVADFDFLNKLPGIKIISKGNHDYWWGTLKNMNEFLQRNNFVNMYFLHNNCYMYGEIAICGSRGWQQTGDRAEDDKMFNRELMRLEVSLKAALRENPKQIVAALHYPPNARFMDLLSAYNVNDCIYGHLHSGGHGQAVKSQSGGVRYTLVSSDYLRFKPLKIYD